jgi:hypothetical protein
MGIENLLALFFGTSIFSCFILRSALKEILRLNIGKKDKYRRVINSQTLFKKLSLAYVKDYVKTHKPLCLTLQWINYIYMGLILIYLAMLLLLTFKMQVVQIIKIITIAKVIILDIPIILFFFIKTGHNNKHGGVKWKI